MGESEAAVVRVASINHLRSRSRQTSGLCGDRTVASPATSWAIP